MTRSERNIVAGALAPNVALVLGLLAWASWRIGTGQPPMPDGVTPIVVGLCGIVPIATVAIANFTRLRREA